MTLYAPQRTEERVRQVGTFDANGRAEIRLPRRRVAQPCIVSRLLAAVPVAAGNLVQDSFSRVVANGWGVPDIGPAYVIGGVAADFDVNGSVGQIAATGNNNIVVAPVNLPDVNAVTAIGVSGAAVGFPGEHRFVVRALDANNYYYIGLTYAAFGVTYNGSSLSRRLGGVDTLLVAGPNPAASGVFVRLIANGSTLTASLWTATEGAPFANVQDLGLTAPGGAGGVRTPSTNQVMNMDTFTVTSPGAAPIWDAYINDPAQLINLVDSSVVAVDRWIPQITNGQRLNPGEELIVVPRSGQPGAQAIVTCSFVYST